jgi:hypothetical protein
MLKNLAQLTKAKKEIADLEAWFEKYDIQAIQYQRDMRVLGESKIDIKFLDEEAYKNAEKIKELRAAIANSNAMLKEHLENLKNKGLNK